MSHNNQKKIAVINDFCGFGRCSVSVSLPVISAMKIQCCPVPTVIFSNHTGFESFYYTDFTSHLDRYIAEWEKLDLHFSGILTGFFGSREQVDIAKRFIDRFRDEGTVVTVDPVMGDYGRLYPTYSEHLAEYMHSLATKADILTPNLTEACILTGTKYRERMTEAELSEICAAISELGPKKIVVSGLELGDELGNFVFERGKAPHMVTERRAGPYRSGTGDVYASIIAADAVNGMDFTESVRHASAFVARCIRRTEELQIPRTDGICFEEFLKEL